jgi:hypothetical protein
MKIQDVRTEWLRLPLARPIADAFHVQHHIDLILVEVLATTAAAQVTCSRLTTARNF